MGHHLVRTSMFFNRISWVCILIDVTSPGKLQRICFCCLNGGTVHHLDRISLGKNAVTIYIYIYAAMARNTTYK